jgi:hypothetical protein
MPETPQKVDSGVDLPDWLFVGAEVATFGYGASRRFGNASFSTVTKIGKRDVVLADGQRFNVRSLSRNTGGTWGNTTYLLPRNDEKVAKAMRARRVRVAALEAEDAIKAWRDTLSDEDRDRAIEALRRA